MVKCEWYIIFALERQNFTFWCRSGDFFSFYPLVTFDFDIVTVNSEFEFKLLILAYIGNIVRSITTTFA